SDRLVDARVKRIINALLSVEQVFGADRKFRVPDRLVALIGAPAPLSLLCFDRLGPRWATRSDRYAQVAQVRKFFRGFSGRGLWRRPPCATFLIALRARAPGGGNHVRLGRALLAFDRAVAVGDVARVLGFGRVRI